MATPYEFTFVRIPANDDEPPVEVKATATAFGDAMQELMKSRFAGGSIKNADGLRAEYGDAVDEKMDALNRVAAAGSVEVFALVRPSSTTMPVPHAGTYFYLDEMWVLAHPALLLVILPACSVLLCQLTVACSCPGSDRGVLKGLPVNKRALQIASTCGLAVESPFLGDIYVGRVRVEPSPMRNVDFTLSELQSGSPFMRSAPSENEQYQLAMAEYDKAAKEKMSEGKDRAGMSGTDQPPPTSPGTWKWAQTPEDLEVTVVLPEGTARRDVVVDVTSRSLRVGLKGGSSPLVDLALFAAVRPDESTWTLAADKATGAQTVQVMVEKAEEQTWNRCEAASSGKMV